MSVSAETDDTSDEAHQNTQTTRPSRAIKAKVKYG